MSQIYYTGVSDYEKFFLTHSKKNDYIVKNKYSRVEKVFINKKDFIQLRKSFIIFVI